MTMTAVRAAYDLLSEARHGRDARYIADLYTPATIHHALDAAVRVMRTADEADTGSDEWWDEMIVAESAMRRALRLQKGQVD